MNRILERARRASGAHAPIFSSLVALAVPFVAAAQGAAPSAGAAGPGAPGPVSHAVSIHDFAFDPTEVTVALGDTVVFTNEDAFVHSVTDDHRAWDSAGIPKSRPWKLVVTGPVSYHCSFHPSMRGELVLD
jgi:plastocyanin